MTCGTRRCSARPGSRGVIVSVKIFSRKGIEKDDRAKAIEAEELDMMEKNLQDEIRILHDEVKKRVGSMLQGQTLRADLFDEVGREKLCWQGTELTAELLQDIPYEAMVRMKIETDDPRLENDLRAWRIERTGRSKSSGSSLRKGGEDSPGRRVAPPGSSSS